MNHGEKLTDVVRAADGTEAEDLLAAGKMHTAVFHRSGIARTGGVDHEGFVDGGRQ